MILTLWYRSLPMRILPISSKSTIGLPRQLGL
uniref:Uncharacterized protein n=1 Tax=Rhizophora mucronata TaxID=61149 RepID=A0A2P2J7M6_RHIMU